MDAERPELSALGLGARPADITVSFEEAVERELEGVSIGELRAAASGLSDRYRSGGSVDGRGGFAPGQHQAYLATRAPATFASVRAVLAELANSLPGWAPESTLDLGAGPGTALWAAVAQFPSINSARLVERDAEMAALGRRLGRSGGWDPPFDPEWIVGDATVAELAESDLVTAAYVLGELGQREQLPALERWWEAARDVLVLVEPGTPAGFERLRAARNALISWGAHVAAPCPHDGPCPMEGTDWCHFAARLERSSLHRDLKGARLGYEDEKYSYLAMSRSRPPRGLAARLLRSPRPHKGHVRLWVCEPGGIRECVVGRSEGEIYKLARAARWGDRLEL
ncbi:MAG: small ribosomal subunit Rsm22 family protein [Acidimicrobiales bacterium]|jgi:ribosomal protein RSM22 (predicted rRNA methylase)